MTIQERLTKNLAVGISRRGFIKGLGMFALALGTALIGKPVEVAKAESWCCPSTDPCTGCLGSGSICPTGYTKMTDSHSCCLNYCKYSCNHCHKDGATDCWCYHDDMVSCPGGYCGSKQGEQSQQSSNSQPKQ